MKNIIFETRSHGLHEKCSESVPEKLCLAAGVLFLVVIPRKLFVLESLSLQQIYMLFSKAEVDFIYIVIIIIIIIIISKNIRECL